MGPHQQADALRQAIIENDVEKAENDLPELIGRVYMLEKKLDTAVQRGNEQLERFQKANKS